MTDKFAEAAGRGMGSAFVFALTAGLLTALTPCVYPMIPITISVFGGRGVSRRRSFGLATIYVAGIATMFGTLGTIFAMLGKAFGGYLASPWVVLPLALFFLAMAASMFGAFELALPSALQQRLARVGGRGVGGVFLMGLVGGLIAAPCTGPPLAGILAFVATTRDAVGGFFLLATYAVGIGVPFWAIAGFSMQMPRSGPWMEAVKSVFGIALIVAALYYLKNVVPQLGRLTGHSGIFVAAVAAAIGLGVAMGAIHLSFHDAALIRARKGVGVALASVGLFALTNYILTPKVELAWLHGEAEALRLAQARHRPIVIDFMADWCLPCKEMDVQVFANPEVGDELRDFTLLRVDLTREDEDASLGALKAKYSVNTLPAVRIVTPKGQILRRFDTVVDVPTFLGGLADGRRAPATVAD
ncbi:MAG: Protein-disulfide reductase [Myxococcales bacterium]|nr:Protein-disulfide reductase [Myxococcales bacterium]